MATQAARYVRVPSGLEKYHTLKSLIASYIVKLLCGVLKSNDIYNRN